jgi:hypothetical protein
MSEEEKKDVKDVKDIKESSPKESAPKESSPKKDGAKDLKSATAEMKKTVADQAQKLRQKRIRVVNKARSVGASGRERADMRLKLLVGVVNPADAAAVVEVCNTFGAALSYSFEGFGTARTAVLDFLGLGETQKRVLFVLIPEAVEKDILKGIQKEMSLYLVGKGICFTVPLTGASSIVANGLMKSLPKETTFRRENRMNENKRTYDLVIAAVESGFADDAMNAAREAGAAGGTFIRATTLNNRKAEQLIGVTLQQDTQILMILTKREGKIPIMRAIQETAGLKTDAGGVLFSVPVDHIIGVGGATPEAKK